MPSRNASGCFILMYFIPLGSRRTPFDFSLKGIVGQNEKGSTVNDSELPLSLLSLKSIEKLGLLQKETGHQLRYNCIKTGVRLWWGWRGSNPRPHRCERCALTSWATSPITQYIIPHGEVNFKGVFYVCTAMASHAYYAA